MPDDLVPPDPNHLRFTIGYALRGGKRGRPDVTVIEDVNRLAADLILRALEHDGYVILQKPPKPHAAIGYSRKIPLKD